MEKVEFTDDVWLSGFSDQYSPQLLKFLTSKDILLILKSGQPPYEVVIGVPHQSKIGDEIIFEKFQNKNGKIGRPSDENAASFALVTFSTLQKLTVPCKLIIAIHATDHDPNKDIKSPYCQEIFSEKMNLLFECHGSSIQRNQDLELSGGENMYSSPVEFGRKIIKNLTYTQIIAAQVSPKGKKGLVLNGHEEVVYVTLDCPGNKTKSLIEASQRMIPALHIEAKPKFRIPSNKSESVTKEGYDLGNAIAQSIII